MYDRELTASETAYPLPVEIVETDVDLYYHLALSMYLEIEAHNRENRPTVFILPVGPVFQYRRFVFLLAKRTLDLSRLHCFFMDEYLQDDLSYLPLDHPLSFRGFIQRELMEALPPEAAFRPEQVLFPDPRRPAAYDERLRDLGGADVCFAGVGINGHLAFNEPPEEGSAMSDREFCALDSRVQRLSRETIAINSHTALRGAIDRVPRFAVTVGVRQILQSGKLRLYLNRPWQGAVVRRLLFGERSCRFPASLARGHADARLILTEEVARRPEAGLK